MNTIIVFSHLRWDFVYQRPQHLLSRLAQNYHVILFEEPEFQPSHANLKTSTPLPNITVCKPMTPVLEYAFEDEQLMHTRPMVKQLGLQSEHPIVWFYTPLALPLLDELEPQAVVYDCMDELSSFHNPPRYLLEREARLLEIADIVFTGGPSLYEAKKHRNNNVHCFPSSVEVSHFRRARDRNIAAPQMSALPKPRLGFFGVIDERFDAELVRYIAEAQPEWQIILVGPVVKIDPASLPQRPNIHYLGQQPYQALPQFLAAWDVCLMPFAMNQSTKFISPTKTLEYMAAELPIVSTPVKDVVDLHSDVVEIASNPSEFVAACARTLSLSDEKKQRLTRSMRNKLARTSWDATASQMHKLLQQRASGSLQQITKN
ncbi:MAG TPA: glycosyltransferase [Methylophilaceae bacterium]|nr:glycosyltransferase [Methylophilaceae bacterium]